MIDPTTKQLDPIKTTKKQLIMLVDDDPKDIEFVEKRLKVKNFGVRAFPDSRNAYDVLKNNCPPDGIRPDLLLCDSVNYKTTGIEFANEVKKLGYTMPIVLITNDHELKLEENSLFAGIIYKPFDPLGFKRRISKYLK